MASKALAFQQACRARTNPLDAALPIAKIRVAGSAREYTTKTKHDAKTSAASGVPRRAVTITNDDGRYHWSELSTGEKAARSTQQSFNFLFVTAGALGTIAVSYLLYAELFAADSKTRQFNHAVDRIKSDAQCRELLGPSNKIIAYGEPTSSKWARARPLAHTVNEDRYGTTHFKMHFNVEGPEAKGTVAVHMEKKKDQDELEYRLLSLTVPGHKTVYLENRDAKSTRTVSKMFGVQWR